MARHSSSALLPLLLLAALLPGRPFIGGGGGRSAPRSALRAVGDRPWRRQGADVALKDQPDRRPSPFGASGRVSPFGRKGTVQREEPEEEEGNRRDVFDDDDEEETEVLHLGSNANPQKPPPVTMDGAGAQLGASGRRKEALEQRPKEELAPVSALEPGMPLQGKVRDYGPGGIIIDCGVSTDGFLASSWLRGEERPKIGQMLDVFVDSVARRPDKLFLSLHSRENTRRMEEVTAGAVLSARITAVASHGMLLDMRLPSGGQPIEGLLLNKFAKAKGRELQGAPNKEIMVQVLSKKQEGGRVSVALVKERDRKLKLTDDMLYLGMRLDGWVRSATKGGVFVDIGLESGNAFLHESHFSKNRGPPLRGERVTVYLDQMKKVPWVRLSKRRSDLRLAFFEELVGKEVFLDGVVRLLTDWGAIVDVPVPNRDDMVQGQLHINNVLDHKELRVGKGVRVRVRTLHVAQGKLFLSMFEGESGRNYRAVVRRDYSVFEGVSNTTWLRAVVYNVKEFGAFVHVRPPGDGVPREALLHVKQILGKERRQFANARDHVKIGQKVRVRLYRLNVEKDSMGVTMRPIEEDFPPDPLKPGTVFDGVVTLVEPIGAFVEVVPEEGKKPIEGLLRFSDDSEMDNFAVGEELRVRVVRLDPETKQLDLDFAEEEEEEDDDDDEEEDSPY